jgi:two-component system response regulator AtoC
MAVPSPNASRILIVEDEAGPRGFLVALLSRDYQVYTADTATNALRVLAEHPVDLIIEDVGLPDQNGIDLLSELKSHYDRNAKVIMMSGAGTVQSAQDAMSLGAIAYLLKPFNIEELLGLVHDTLEPHVA